MISQPVGLSGPLIISSISSSVASGFLTNLIAPSINSSGLCGKMSDAIPQPIPDAPLIIASGIRAGNTRGFVVVLSKFGIKSTAFLLSDSSNKLLYIDRRVSV